MKDGGMLYIQIALYHQILNNDVAKAGPADQ